MPLTWSQDKFIKAFTFAAEAHGDQKLPGSELPYMVHVGLVCMEIMALHEIEPMKNPDLALQCAALHDVVEDKQVPLEIIRNKFGNEVADGVDALSKKKCSLFKLSAYLKKIKTRPKEISIVKLADRIINLQPPPCTWTKEKAIKYWEGSKIILYVLKEASPYMAARLEKKITEYEKFTS
jgi:(p)ppGpp synthase/HD superfamily hydrolase